MESIPSDRPGDPPGIELDRELALLDLLVEQATPRLLRPTEDEQPSAASLEAPVFTPGDVWRTQHAFRQAWVVREQMLEKQRRVPRDGSVSSSVLIFADAQVAKAQQAYEAALRDQKAARDQAVVAVACAREFATPGERRALLEELVALDASELDRRWDAHQAVERVAARVAAERTGRSEVRPGGQKPGPRRRAKDVLVLRRLIGEVLAEQRGLMNDPEADLVMQDVVESVNDKNEPGHNSYTVRTLWYRLNHWPELRDPSWRWPKKFPSACDVVADAASSEPELNENSTSSNSRRTLS